MSAKTRRIFEVVDSKGRAVYPFEPMFDSDDPEGIGLYGLAKRRMIDGKIVDDMRAAGYTVREVARPVCPACRQEVSDRRPWWQIWKSYRKGAA